MVNLEELEKTLYHDIMHKLNNDELVLPRVPEMMDKINKLISDDEVPFRKIAEVIQYDIPISARIIKIANSAIMRGKTEITSVQSAISRVGINIVRNIILTEAFKDKFKSKNKALNDVIADSWEHSIEIAILAASFSEFKEHLNADIAMTCGIVHDIGVLPIVAYLEKSDEIKGLNEGETAFIAERIIDDLHVFVGVKILEEWGFSPEIINAVQMQHNINPNFNPKTDYADLINAAELCSQTAEKIQNTRKPATIPYNNSTSKVDIAGEEPQVIFDRISDKLLEIKDFLLT